MLCFCVRMTEGGKERLLVLITNNPKVLEDGKIICPKEYIDGSYRDVLIAVRDRIHKGHTLLSHPLSGSVKPNETPYKSVLIGKEIGSMDLDSLRIIEDSIAACDKFMKSPIKYGHNNSEALLDDFSEVDYELIVGALAGASN